MAKKTNTIIVNDTRISVLLNPGDADYLSLTDMTRSFEEGNKLIEKWLNNKSTIDYIGFWESINNPDFTPPPNSGELEWRLAQGYNRKRIQNYN